MFDRIWKDDELVGMKWKQQSGQYRLARLLVANNNSRHHRNSSNNPKGICRVAVASSRGQHTIAPQLDNSNSIRKDCSIQYSTNNVAVSMISGKLKCLFFSISLYLSLAPLFHYNQRHHSSQFEVIRELNKSN